MIKKIEGLEEALERESKALRVSELDYDDIEIFITAARAYAKIQSGEFVVVPREPTEEMIKAGILATMEKTFGKVFAQQKEGMVSTITFTGVHEWKAMLGAVE